MELNLQNPLTSHEDLQYDGVSALFSNESDHSPSLLSVDSSDFRFSVRRSVFSLLSHAKLNYDIDPFIIYLSVNYVDRFLSKQQILIGGGAVTDDGGEGFVGGASSELLKPWRRC
ncbi:hypothetical protein CASFOL_012334 [Castilleja foliolosa]|uniref:Cyclin N-terminal domain-containing protein n=1 Tax=Castilleja foliolosa TaxID=1961234 RepID=A0ABD3DSI2_9LAMI